MANYGRFQVKIGDTERSVEEIIDNMRKSGLSISHIEPMSGASNPTGRGATLTLETTAEELSQDDLKRQLNEHGGCMYQVASVVKSPE